MEGHDIIVVGASAGGVEALSQLVVQFPKDLAATVFITQHVTAAVSIPGDLLVEDDMTEHPSHSELVKELSTLVPLICPDCGGPLWELRHKKLVRYRCRLGHTFTAESLLEGQSAVPEQTLWAAVHTMEERTRILTSLASSSRERGQTQLAELHDTRAAELQTHVQKLRQILLRDW